MDYTGMTVNERLFVGGLMDDFDKAIEEKDPAKMIEVLSQIDIGDSNIRTILQEYGLV
jgi:hypothetical protein